MHSYGTRALKRRRRTKASVAQLERQIHEALRDDHPQSVRHLFYRMTDPRLPEPVGKSEEGYRAVQRRIVELRRAGTIPFAWVTDLRSANTFANVSGSGPHRTDLWQNAAAYCEVWVESRSIAGVLRHDCEQMSVPLFATGKFTSISFAYEAARQINRGHAGREAVILYIGDHDPVRHPIDAALERELRLHLDPSVRLRVERIAITLEQIETYGLPTKPRRRRSRYLSEDSLAVEAEAMAAAVLRNIVRNRIEAILPADAFEAACPAEMSGPRLISRPAEDWT